MSVSEKGRRAIYRAQKKVTRGNGRTLEAAVCRESFSGRIAAMYHNNDRLFSMRKFTLIPRNSFRVGANHEKPEQLQTIYERLSLSRRSTELSRAGPRPSTVRTKVEQVVHRVRQLTFLQSEDPNWFLAPAFPFTSRTSHGFFIIVASNFEK